MHKVQDTDAKIVAVLHDVLEDTPTSAEDLLALGFSTNIVNAILAVTKKDGENCTALKNEYSRASGSFNLNPNPATCTSFKAAVISYQNSNCPTTVERQQL